MTNYGDLPSIYDGCQPRKDIIEGEYELETFAANLSMVVLKKGSSVYTEPEAFFKNTYPTEGLKTTIKEVFGRLSGTYPGAPVVKLETGLGGGKTHALIALYHLAKNGTSIKGIGELIGNMKFKPLRVAAIVGTELSVEIKSSGPNTLWGEMALQLFGKEGYEKIKGSDQQLTSPGERDLRNLFGKEKCLILMDEIAIYLAKAAGVNLENKKSTLGDQSVAFLQELSQVAAALDNVELVITTLDDKSVFKEKTKKIKDLLENATKREEINKNIKDAERVLSRLVQSLEPTKGEEFAHIIRHRLFDSIDPEVREKVVDSYLHGYRSEGIKEHLSSIVQDPEFKEVMLKSYPFHPDIINILRTKTSSIEDFNQTRGVLRFLSILIKTVWDNKVKTPLIHPYHIDLSQDIIFGELINRLNMGELKPAISEDLTNKDKETRAEMVDKNYSEPYGTWVTTTVVLQSLTGRVKADVHKGANLPEIHMALYKPGLDPETINNVLDDLDNTWFYFGKEGQYYVCGLNPRMTKIIENSKNQIDLTKVNQEVEDWIRRIFHSKKYFKTILFPSAPSGVGDDTNLPKLTVMHHSDSSLKLGTTVVPELVRKIFEETGTQGKPRSYINNIIFLVADEERIKHMNTQVRTSLALGQLIQDFESGESYIASLTKEQYSKLKNTKNETELYVKVAVLIAYKHVIIPSIQASLGESGGVRPQRILSMRDTERDIESRIKSGNEAEDDIVKFLRDQEVAKTADDNHLSPERILDALWKKTSSSINGDEFKKMFYKQASAGIHFSEELIRSSMKDGIQQGKWYAVIGEKFYDQDNYQSFSPGFTSDTVLTIAEVKEGKDLYEKFHCSKCQKKKDECNCSEKDKEQTSETEKVSEPIKITQESSFQKSSLSLERFATELKAWATDNNIKLIDNVEFEALSRAGLSILSRALKQFRTNVNISFDVDGKMERELDGRMRFEIKFAGKEDGFNKLKSAIIDYLPQEDFDYKQLLISVEFPKGYKAEEFAQDLGEKIATFTTGHSYNITVLPKEE